MYKKILVPLDGSEMAECSLEQAKDIALGCHVPEVTILSVIEPSVANIPYKWGGAEFVQPEDIVQTEEEKKQMASLDQKAMKAAGGYLAKIADKYLKEGVNVKTQVIEGKAADSILDFASKNDYDLVILSTHGRSGKSHFDFGKVTDKIIHSSNIPVIVASPPGCRA